MFEMILAHETTILIIFRIWLIFNLLFYTFKWMLTFKSEDSSPGQFVSSVAMMIFSVETFVLSFIIPILWLLRLTALYLFFYWLYLEYVLMRWFRTKFFAFQVLRKIVIQISLILFNVFSFVCVSHEPSLIDVFRTHKIIIAVLAVVALVMAIVHIIFAFKNKPFEIDSEQGVHLISGLIDIFKFAVLLILLICCIITLRG